MGAAVGMTGAFVAGASVEGEAPGRFLPVSGHSVGKTGSCVVLALQLVDWRYGQPVKPNCDVGPSARAVAVRSIARMVVRARCFLNMFQFTSVFITIT